MVAVAVGAVVHDLAVADLAQRVYLPEDDAAVAAAAQPVAQGGALHLLAGQVAAGHHGAAEVALCRQAPLPQRPRVAGAVVAQFMAQGLKGVGE